MRNRIFTTPSSSTLFRLLLFLFLSTTVFFWGCDKAEEAVSPAVKEFVAEQVQKIKAGNAKEDKDDKYKTDKTGQYVSKDVQITGYENGSERPTRPKFDAAAGRVGTKDIAPCDPCGGSGGTTTPTVTSTFLSSESIGGYGSYYYNRNNLIQDLKIIKGSSSSINTGDLPGYYKINADLNRGVGGQYIYLCFTRDPEKVQGSISNPGAWKNDERIGWKVPVRGIVIKSQSFGPTPPWPDYWTPPVETKDGFGGFHIADLNDGARGKYIYAFQRKDSYDATLPYVKEVGVLYGNSSSIQPPSGWERIPGDLNEGAGGDYIYFCIKY